MTRHSVEDHGDLRKYFAAIPHVVFKLGLNPFELALYAHFKQAAGDDGGACWKSRATIAKEAKMSSGMVTKARQALEVPRTELGGRPLITVCEEPSKSGGKPTCRVMITDVWAVNMANYSTSPHDVAPVAPSLHDVATSPHDQRRHHTTIATSPHVPKEKHKKKNQEETIGAHARLMAFHDSHLVGGIPDAGAQGAAIKWLLERYTPELCEREYNKLMGEEWRTTPVTWLTVKKHIGSDLARSSNGHNTNDTGEKILADYGDWYTVEGADGTPSKRYRTPEAFARETGRDLEEVRANWN